MEGWFCIWDDLLYLFARARLFGLFDISGENPIIDLNLVPNSCNSIARYYPSPDSSENPFAAGFGAKDWNE
jgi:hypothetical protein